MTTNQRLVLVLAILATFVAFLDSSIVNVALPQISDQLGGGLLIQQWVNDAYLITLGTLILAAGSLSDNFGHKKILVVGLIGFLVTSLLCAVAPTGEVLIVARGLQGVAGALLVPSSLALIMGSFRGAAQAKAIGTWTGWTGISFIIGPLVGGVLVDLASWRLVFAINILPIVVALLLTKRLELKNEPKANGHIDVLGIVLGAAGLGGIVYALIEQGNFGWSSPLIWGTFAVGILALIGFVVHEKRVAHPMLPLDIFKNRNFSAGNIATFLIYAALSLQGFLLVIFLQQIAGYPATFAGLALVPTTIIMFFLSSRFGALAGKYGPRLFMTLGPVLSGLGTTYMLNVELPTNYWTQIFPGIIIFGIGLSMTVAPLTSAILGSIAVARSGIGSAINNAVARIAGLLSVAMIGLLVGKSLDIHGFKVGLLVCAVLFIVGGVVSWVGIRNTRHL